MLRLRFNDRHRSGIWLSEPRYVIGRNPSNTVVIDEEGISDFHAELIVEADNRVYLTDLCSEQGTRLNGDRVELPTRIVPTDVIQIGDVELELTDPAHQMMRMPDDAVSVMMPAFREVSVTTSPYDAWTLYATSGDLLGRRYPVPPSGNLLLGRSHGSDIVLPGVHISRRHAQVWCTEGRLFVCDLDSASGTWVNRAKVSEVELHGGDDLRIDHVVFRIEAPCSALKDRNGREALIAGDAHQAGSASRLADGALSRFAGRQH